MSELELKQQILEQSVQEQKNKIEHLENEVNDLRASIGERFLTASQDAQKELDKKTPSKLFYLFISTFTILYLYGLISVYTKSTQNILAFTQGFTSIRITQTKLAEKLDYTIAKSDHIETEILKLRDQVSEILNKIKDKN